MMRTRLFASLAFTWLLLLCAPPASVLAAGSEAEAFSWKTIEKGLEFGEHQFAGRSRTEAPDVILLRIDPQHFDFRLVTAKDLGKTGSDVKTLTEHINGQAGINANFFDESGVELGLVVVGGVTKHKLHRGGNLLTGVFYLKGTEAAIVHRDSFTATNADIATQSGPRLIAAGKALTVNDPLVTSRRSGVAITKNGQIILFATVTRFPGASFDDIQQMLLKPELGVVDALNFDGGSSSQLFIADNRAVGAETVISGGAEIPVVLVVKRKSK